MLKKLLENTPVHIFILFAAAVLSFLPTLEMYFYLDEWGNLYEFTHIPYQFTLFTSHMFYLLFNIFGINPTGYFAVGIFIFALSAVALYIFVNRLLNNKILAFSAGLAYVTSPVGIDTVIMLWTYFLEGGYPLTIILLVILYLGLKFFQGGKIYYYFLALLTFTVFLELEPRRAFLLLPIIVLFDYLMHFRKTVVPDVKFFLRQAPFFVSFIAYYKYTITLSGILLTRKIVVADSLYDSQTKIDLLMNSFFHIQPLITLANILLGSFLIYPTEYLNLTAVKYTNLWVVLVLVIAAAMIIIGWKVRKEYGLTLLFCLGWIYINILGIYVFSSPGISETTHRTLSISAPAQALFITLSGFSLYLYLKSKKNVNKLKLKKFFIFTLVSFILLNFVAIRTHFEKFNTWRSRPAHAFFRDLKSFYPVFQANSILYIETSKDPQIKHRLSRIYGGNNLGAGATIAVFYPELDFKEIDVVKEYKDVEKFTATDSAKINYVYAFYFDENGLKDQTQKIRSKLKE